MSYRSLWLQHFRSYSDYKVSLSSGVTIVVGPNGSGKTNLLEALQVLATGSSFRGGDKEMLQHSASWFRIEALYNDEKRVIVYNPEDEQSPKHVSLDGVKRTRLTHSHRLPVVLFEPDFLRLLSSSPARRRDYIDNLLASLQSDYSRQRSQFERALLQRNNILKQALHAGSVEDYLFAWDIKLSELAETLVERRCGLIAYINAQLSQVYSQIAGKGSDVHIEYISEPNLTDYKAKLLKSLSKQLTHDIQRGFTSVGPHRDDFKVMLNSAPASTTASRGENRTLVLALKMIELQLLEEQAERPPLLLLDDVFSELDTTRRQALSSFASKYQTVITTTDADMVQEMRLSDIAIIETATTN